MLHPCEHILSLFFQTITKIIIQFSPSITAIFHQFIPFIYTLYTVKIFNGFIRQSTILLSLIIIIHIQLIFIRIYFSIIRINRIKLLVSKVTFLILSNFYLQVTISFIGFYLLLFPPFIISVFFKYWYRLFSLIFGYLLLF